MLRFGCVSAQNLIRCAFIQLYSVSRGCQEGVAKIVVAASKRPLRPPFTAARFTHGRAHAHQQAPCIRQPEPRASTRAPCGLLRGARVPAPTTAAVILRRHRTAAPFPPIRMRAECAWVRRSTCVLGVPAPTTVAWSHQPKGEGGPARVACVLGPSHDDPCVRLSLPPCAKAIDRASSSELQPRPRAVM